MNIAIIVKPPSKEARLRTLQASLAGLREAGHRLRVRQTSAPGDARRLAYRAARAGAELVIAAGGDGTVNEVVRGIAHARCNVRVGIVPLGTANDFATGSGIPKDPAAALAVALNGRAVLVDLGCVNRRPFINVSTGGFGANATSEAPHGLKRRLGALAYLLTGARNLLAMQPERARFVIDGRTVHEGEFVFFAVGNAGRTGGGTRIAPRADVRDGRLDIIVVPGVSRLEFLALLPDLRAGTHLESPDVLYLRARRFEVHGAREIAVNVDGEPLRSRDLVYTLHPRPIEIMLPG